MSVVKDSNRQTKQVPDNNRSISGRNIFSLFLSPTAKLFEKKDCIPFCHFNIFHPVNIFHPASSKSTLSATYLYLAQHRLTVNQHKMSPSAPVDALLVSFHDNVPGYLLGHANVLIRAREKCLAEGGQRFCYILTLSSGHAHTSEYTHRSIKPDISFCLSIRILVSRKGLHVEWASWCVSSRKTSR